MRGRLVVTLLAFALLAAPAGAAERVVRFDPGETSRARLEQRLERLGLQVEVLRALPFAGVSGPAELIRRARRIDGVASVHANRRLA